MFKIIKPLIIIKKMMRIIITLTIIAIIILLNQSSVIIFSSVLILLSGCPSILGPGLQPFSSVPSRCLTPTDFLLPDTSILNFQQRSFFLAGLTLLNSCTPSPCLNLHPHSDLQPVLSTISPILFLTSQSMLVDEYNSHGQIIRVIRV